MICLNIAQRCIAYVTWSKCICSRERISVNIFLSSIFLISEHIGNIIVHNQRERISRLFPIFNNNLTVKMVRDCHWNRWLLRTAILLIRPYYFPRSKVRRTGGLRDRMRTWERDRNKIARENQRKELKRCADFGARGGGRFSISR